MNNRTGGERMSPKELSYIDDALGHESILKTQCQEAAHNLQDPELSAFSRQIEEKHKQLFDNFYHLT